MKQKNEASGIAIWIGVIIVALAVVGAVSLHHVLAGLNGWQAAAYAVVAGIFIALVGVILNFVISFFRHN